MNRRTLLKLGLSGIVAASCSTPLQAGSTRLDAAIRERPDLARPSTAQLKWQNAEIGLIYHFDLPIAARVVKPNNTVKRTLDPKRYDPQHLHTDQWLEAARAVEAGYAVFTATHFNGFMQWQSDIYPYSLKQAAWRNGEGDLVEDFVASCDRFGVPAGLYLSTHRNAYWDVWNHYVEDGRGTEAQARYNRAAEEMCTELWGRYGNLLQCWFDAGQKVPEQGGPQVLPIFERLQPNSVFYHNVHRADHRWIGNEAGRAGSPCWATMPAREKGPVSHASPTWQPHLETGVEGGGCWSPGMATVPLRGTNGVHNWFWRPGEAHAVYSPQQLMEIYDRTVGRNCNLVLGVVVDPEGRVPQPDIEALAAFREALDQRFANPLGQARGVGQMLHLPLEQPQPVGQVVLMEQIAHGERVRKYRVEGQVPDGSWRSLASGHSIGHKWIHTFDPVPVNALRLRVEKAAATPIIRNFAVYR